MRGESGDTDTDLERQWPKFEKSNLDWCLFLKDNELRSLLQSDRYKRLTFLVNKSTLVLRIPNICYNHFIKATRT